MFKIFTSFIVTKIEDGARRYKRSIYASAGACMCKERQTEEAVITLATRGFLRREKQSNLFRHTSNHRWMRYREEHILVWRERRDSTSLELQLDAHSDVG